MNNKWGNQIIAFFLSLFIFFVMIPASKRIYRHWKSHEHMRIWQEVLFCSIALIDLIIAAAVSLNRNLLLGIECLFILGIIELIVFALFMKGVQK